MRAVLSYMIAVVTVVLAAVGPAAAQFYGLAPKPGEPSPEASANVGYDQKLDGSKVPLDLPLFDPDGRPVSLGRALGGKPAVLVLHYNRCPQLCNEVIRDLLDALNDARRADPAFVAGEAFRVVFVSIDPREPPAACRKNRETFVADYDRRPADAPGVSFLTTSHGQGTDVRAADRTVHTLAAAVGFRYELRFRNREYLYNTTSGQWVTSDGKTELPAEPRAYDYGHPSGIVIVSPDGAISRYLLGKGYKARDLRLALVEASGGKIGALSDAIALACFSYDQKTGHYKIAMRFIAAAFAPVMLFVVYLSYRTWRQVRSDAGLLRGTAAPTAV